MPSGIQQSQSQQSQSQQQSQKSIKRKLKKFKISQDQYNRAVVNFEEDDLEILQYVFLEDFEADDIYQQINQNLLRQKMENGNYVEIKTKKMHVELKKIKEIEYIYKK